uniref:Uncharacterized protein n=1 Tax=Panagrolaimus superbus TaxID=310955 RepID=A0A914YRJ2_9BILA
MISGNPDLIYLETESFLSQKIIVKIENEEIKSFEIGEILPLQYSDILNNISGYSGLEIEMANSKIRIY